MAFLPIPGDPNDPFGIAQYGGLGAGGWGIGTGGINGGPSAAPMPPGSGFGFNANTLNLALNGLGTIGGLWGALQQAKIAKRALNYQKDFANINLANQTQSYNTAIADRARARGFTEGQSQAQIDDYIARNSLQQRTVG